MNELNFSYKVRQHLNRGLYELRPETADRLAAARKIALAHQKQTVRQSILATAGSYFHFSTDNLRIKQFVAAVVLAICAVTASLWVADQRINELSEIDSALLADELPISAFTDKGFSAWLKQGASQ